MQRMYCEDDLNNLKNAWKCSDILNELHVGG